MRLIRERRSSAGDAPRYAVEDDSFLHVEGDAEISASRDVIVSLERWRRDRDTLALRAGRTGVRLPSDAKADDIAADLPRLAVVAIEFPKFVDGRGYTIARRLREQHAYAGELRAVGNVLRDQLHAMARCGFDAFEVDPSKKIDEVLSAFTDFSVVYQPAADEKLPIWKRQARAWPSKIES